MGEGGRGSAEGQERRLQVELRTSWEKCQDREWNSECKSQLGRGESRAQGLQSLDLQGLLQRGIGRRMQDQACLLDCSASVCMQDGREARLNWKKNKSCNALNETRKKNQQDLITEWMWKKEDVSPICILQEDRPPPAETGRTGGNRSMGGVSQGSKSRGTPRTGRDTGETRKGKRLGWGEGRSFTSQVHESLRGLESSLEDDRVPYPQSAFAEDRSPYCQALKTFRRLQVPCPRDAQNAQEPQGSLSLLAPFCIDSNLSSPQHSQLSSRKRAQPGALSGEPGPSCYKMTPWRPFQDVIPGSLLSWKYPQNWLGKLSLETFFYQHKT